MSVGVWYEADALMADLTGHCHTMTGTSEDEIERRIRDLYPDAVAVLVCRKMKTKAGKEEKREVSE